jgi:SAM-dependent methyltransferase
MTAMDVVDAFDAAFVGQPCELVRSDGSVARLPVRRWAAEPDVADRRLLIDRCTGPTLDIGCGPGRLTAALGARGVLAMGIDVSGVAVLSTQARGAAALRRDVFGDVPAAGRWRHALLADGNIGIGADPVRLLRRLGQLLHPGGVAIVEVARPGVGIHREEIRLRIGDRVSAAFGWAWVGADAIGSLARAAGLRPTELVSHHDRWVAILTTATTTARAAVGEWRR